ncbi:MAG TPA: nucleotidyltransferase domain-containing protein [Vicinamibacteria bacterium]|nr:nucleotidyltransferase domain-containing protein [Vicinamibacteria bacterium]
MTEDEDVSALRERAKELRCLYEVGGALSRRQDPVPEVFARVLAALPPAMLFPEDATARIEYLGRTHALFDFVETPWRLRASISIWRTQVGSVEVVYRSQHPAAWEGPFLREERQLLDRVGRRLGEYLEWKQRELGGERLGAAPEHWRWRQRFAERLAASIDPARFGVREVYLYGSSELGTAGPASDIDLLVSFDGDEAQRRELLAWLDGWSLCLGEVAFQMLGVPVGRLVSAKLVDPARARTEVQAAHLAGRPLRPLPVGTAGTR